MEDDPTIRSSRMGRREEEEEDELGWRWGGPGSSWT